MSGFPNDNAQPHSGARPYIAAVIPSLRGDVDPLVHALMAQTWPPDEIEVVVGVQPNGRARNTGLANLRGPARPGQDCLVLFIDDDALPGQPGLIEKLACYMVTRPGDDPAGKVGVSGAARILPPGAGWFQRRVAAEIPRTVNAVPGQPLPSNPPLVGYGHSLITTTCCMVWKSTAAAVGGFSNELTSGVDTDFFYRVRRSGVQFIMAPDVYVLHPAPHNLRDLWRKFHWYGKGYAQETRLRPEQGMGFRLNHPLLRVIFLMAASLWLLPNIFILTSFSYPKFALGFRPLKAISTYAVAWGYAAGWQAG